MDLIDWCKWLGMLLLAGYAALVLREMTRYFGTALASPIEPRPTPGARVGRGRLLAEVLAAFIVSRLAVALVCAWAYRAENGGLEGFIGAFSQKLNPWDAGHYVDIIQNGYVAEGNERLFIVFFPFYPMLCRIVTFMTGISALAAARIVSNAALVGCGAAIYRLAELDGGAAQGRRSMLLMMFCPLTYFYSIAYSESTFLLLTLLAVLCARRRRWALAVMFGAMSASARLLGMATAVPIFWEMLRADREAALGRGEAQTGGTTARRVLLCVLRVLPVSLGLLAYMSVNWHLFGNPMQFTVFEREHWHQSFGTIGNTFRYSLYNALTYDDALYTISLWWPQVALSLAVPLLILWRGKRENPGDTAYSLVYHYVSFAPTWLLSGARYCSANYALYPMLARVPKGRRGFIALFAAECALLAGAVYIGLWRGKVY